MDPTLILSLYGAGLSTVLAAPALHRWIQDRPRLRVSLSYVGEYDRMPGYESLVEFPTDLVGVSLDATLVVEVRNDGRLDGVVREVGLALSTDPDGTIRSFVPLTADNEITAVPSLGLKRFTREQFAVPPVEHVDIPVRAYAVDARGRIHWSPPETLFRDLLRSGWSAESEITAALTAPHATGPDAKRVRPRWRSRLPWNPRGQ